MIDQFINLLFVVYGFVFDSLRLANHCDWLSCAEDSDSRFGGSFGGGWC